MSKAVFAGLSRPFVILLVGSALFGANNNAHASHLVHESTYSSSVQNGWQKAGLCGGGRRNEWSVVTSS
jgi:hypothetical protein